MASFDEEQRGVAADLHPVARSLGVLLGDRCRLASGLVQASPRMMTNRECSKRPLGIQVSILRSSDTRDRQSTSGSVVLHSAVPCSFSRTSTRQCKKPRKCRDDVDAARCRPLDEFGYVDAAIARLAIVNPALRLIHPRAEISLSQSGLFSQKTQKIRQWPIFRRVLRLGRHLPRLSGQIGLTRVQCQLTILVMNLDRATTPKPACRGSCRFSATMPIRHS